MAGPTGIDPPSREQFPPFVERHDQTGMSFTGCLAIFLPPREAPPYGRVSTFPS
jgi:hypothetical protein